MKARNGAGFSFHRATSSIMKDQEANTKNLEPPEKPQCVIPADFGIQIHWIVRSPTYAGTTVSPGIGEARFDFVFGPFVLS
jgi:hypothetical protein